MKRVCSLLVACAASLAIALTGPAGAEEKSLFVSYEVNQYIHTATDDREVTTTIYLAGMNGFGYRRQEWILGAIDPVVTNTAFSNESLVISPEDQAAFGQALLDAGVFDLNPPPPANNHPDQTWWLNVRIHDREGDIHAYAAPTAGVAQAVDAVIRDYAHRMHADQPKEAPATSEGDRQPPRPVTLAEVLAHPDDYDGKRILVTGYFHFEFEGSSFCVDKAGATGSGVDTCVWLGEPSTFADPKDVAFVNDATIKVEGVFFKGPGGHMGMWPGEIQRLTRMQPAS